MRSSHSISEPLARWSRRFSFFALALTLVTLVLHRFGQMTTPVAINLVLGAFACAALGIVAGLLAGISIWVRGRTGAGLAAAGLISGALLLLWPLAYVPPLLSLPALNDITTDPANPPRFGMIAKVRGPAANPATYPGEAFARRQGETYPDLRTLVVDRSVDEVFDLVAVAVKSRRGLAWRVMGEEPPTVRPPKPGIIEATERTTIVGFVDDIVIRVSGTDTEARVDIRSASRFGAHDFGANASRIRRFVREVQARIEATTPGSAFNRGARAARAQTGGPAGAVPKGVVKKVKDRLPETAAPKTGRGSVPPDAQRGPGPKAPPRG